MQECNALHEPRKERDHIAVECHLIEQYNLARRAPVNADQREGKEIRENDGQMPLGKRRKCRDGDTHAAQHLAHDRIADAHLDQRTAHEERRQHQEEELQHLARRRARLLDLHLGHAE